MYVCIYVNKWRKLGNNEQKLKIRVVLSKRKEGRKEAFHKSVKVRPRKRKKRNLRYRPAAPSFCRQRQ